MGAMLDGVKAAAPAEKFGITRTYAEPDRGRKVRLTRK